MWKTGLLILVLGALAVSLYVRRAPIPGKHFAPREGSREQGTHIRPGGSRFVLPALSQVKYQRLTALVLNTPRVVEYPSEIAHTRFFVVRSWVWGFPDVIHMTHTADALILDGNLVYGHSDMGVNRRRILGWLQAVGIDPLT